MLTVVPLLGVAALIVVIALLVQQDSSYTSSYLSDSADPAAAVEAQIPAEGACVTSDYAILAIIANRFNPAGPGCPAVVDPFGIVADKEQR